MIQLASIFTDGAVLQRRIPIAVFGKTEPNTFVKCTLDGHVMFGAAGLDGSFLLRMNPLEAGGPFTLAVENLGTGEKTELHDVMIGEVWLASGQSNMEYHMETSAGQMKEFIAENRNPSMLRMFTVKRRASAAPENKLTGKWEYSTPEHLGPFSAVASWFGKKLHDTLNVPVGIIHSSWGGTIIEAWTSRSTLLANPDYAPTVAKYEAGLDNPECWEYDLDTPGPAGGEITQKQFSELCEPDPGDDGFKLGYARPDFDDSRWKIMDIPGSWKIAGIGLNGAVWARLHISVPRSMIGKKCVLHTGGIDKVDRTWFNGTEVGATLGTKTFEDTVWNVPRKYPVPAELNRSAAAVVAIRAFSFAFDGSFNGHAEDWFLECPETGETVNFAGEARAFQSVDQGNRAFGTSARSMPGTPNTPYILFDSMIRPLIPYSIRGAIWYQGENNAGVPSEIPAYERKMCGMIRDWRFHWGEGDFPFILTQLANYQQPLPYNKTSAWAVMRDVQRRAAAETPNTGMAVITDVGEAADIHPRDKRTPGCRLAAWALKNTYALPGIALSPLPRGAVCEGAAIRIFFENCDGGLRLAPVHGFYIADERKKFVPADARVEGESLVLSSKEIPSPAFVRYAWADNPSQQGFSNGAGLPASPFEIGVL